MTKQEFVDQVSNESGLGKKEAGDAVDAVLKVIEETLSRGGEVYTLSLHDALPIYRKSVV